MICHYLDLGSASDWLKHMLLVIINYCFVSRIPCSFLFLLGPSCSPCSPCSPFPFLFPLFRLFLLVPPYSFVPLVPPCSLVPLFPLFPLFLLFPTFSPCSPLFPYSLLFPLSPFVSLVAPCAPCSPVSLVRLQFTTLNVLQPQISVNEKNSLRKHPFLLALRRCGRFAGRNVCDSATEIPY